MRTSLSVMLMLALLLLTPIWGQEQNEPAPRSEDDRGYRKQRQQSLERHERFERDGIPPGYTVKTWAEEMAATQAYDRGYEDGFRDGLAAARREMSSNRRSDAQGIAMAEGIEKFRKGDYGGAVRHLTLAARLDQGDPMSRLHAAHALVALGHYDDAALLLKRAFQLQPALMNLDIDVRDHYDDRQEFLKHINQLHADAEANPSNAAVWTLLGYYRFYSDDPLGGYRAIRHALKLEPGDRWVGKLHEIARLSVPASEVVAERGSGEREK